MDVSCSLIKLDENCVFTDGNYIYIYSHDNLSNNNSNNNLSYEIINNLNLEENLQEQQQESNSSICDQQVIQITEIQNTLVDCPDFIYDQQNKDLFTICNFDNGATNYEVTNKDISRNEVNFESNINETEYPINEIIVQNQNIREIVDNETVNKGKFPQFNVRRKGKKPTFNYKRTKLKNQTSLNTNFTCELCPNKQFNSLILLNRHKKEHIYEKANKCPECNEGFNFIENLHIHITIHNGNSICEFCNKKFNRLASLKGHLSTYHFRSEYFNCDYCDEIFLTKTFLTEHINNAHDKIIENYKKKKRKPNDESSNKILKKNRTCEICHKFFSKPCLLQRHMRVHNGEKPYKCNLCDTKFSQKSSLGIHLLRHTGKKPYMCPHCFLKFAQKGNLKIHIQRLHEKSSQNETSYPCLQCTCVFRTLGPLNRHITDFHSKIKTNSRNYGRKAILKKQNEKTNNEIENDEIDFKQIMSQLNEIKQTSIIKEISNNNEINKPNENESSSHTTDNQINNIIELADRKENGTIVHQKAELILDKNGKRRVSCLYCKKKFTRPSDLLRHIRTHTRDKPFECVLCKKRFALKTALSTHSKTHENKRRKFSCYICNKNFRELLTLDCHVKELHSTNDMAFQCYPCKKRYFNADELLCHSKDHKKEIRTNRRKIIKETTKKLNLSSLFPSNQNIALREPLVLMENGDVIETINRKSNISSNENNTSRRPHICYLCNIGFLKSCHLKQHILGHTGVRPHKCKYCDKSFQSKNSLKIHVRGHLGEKPYGCLLCSNKFVSKQMLNRHKISHSNERKFICPYCPKRFKSTVDCRKHIKRHKNDLINELEQSNEIINPNELCALQQAQYPNEINSNLYFSNIDDSQIQFISIENNEENINSLICVNENINELPVANEMNSYNLLIPVPNENEENIHLEEPFSNQYENVDKTSTSAGFLDNNNTTTEVPSDRHCKYCQRYFKKPIDLRRHERTHTGERPFECEKCKKTFALGSTLKLHEKTHMELKEKFSCHVCSNEFLSKGSLKVHMRIHTGDRPYKCQYCVRTFRTIGNKNVHESNHVKIAIQKGIDPKDAQTARASKFQSIFESLSFEV